MKTYTKETLREVFQAFQLGAGDFDMTRGLDGSYESIHTQIAWISWLECARFLGVMDEPGFVKGMGK